jgi:hypothetical protein
MPMQTVPRNSGLKVLYMRMRSHSTLSEQIIPTKRLFLKYALSRYG